MKKRKNSILDQFKSFGKLIISGFSFSNGQTDDMPESNAEDINSISLDNNTDVLKEEAIKSPSKQALINFFKNPFGVIGLFLFLFILLSVFIGSKFIPFNPYFSVGSLKNIGPGKGYKNIPSELVQGKGVKEISVGSTFSVGVSNDNKVYVWGKDSGDKVTTVPESVQSQIKGKEIEHVAAGDRHIILSTKDGLFVGWGNNAFQQTMLPPAKSSKIKSEGVAKLGAGIQYSVVLTKKNNLVVWGSTLNNRLNQVPSTFDGKVVDFDTNASNIMVLLKDGSIAVLGTKGSEIDTQIPKELKDKKVVKIALSQRSAAALTEDGKLYSWGASRDNLSQNYIPKYEGKVTELKSSENSFTILTDKGKLYSWGVDSFGEVKDTPKDDLKYDKLFTGYYDKYAFTKDGKSAAWGLDGFLFGTDDTGRDIFTRIIHGGKMTIMISFLSVLIQIVIGVVVGMISGYAGGRIDNLLMRITEIVSSFPFYPLVITLSALLPVNVSQNKRLAMIMVILGILGWTSIARLVRGQILAEREKDYITASRALGLTNFSILVKHILPNILSIIIVNSTIGFASNLLTEAGLSFLGFGVRDPYPSWGNMMTSAQTTEVVKVFWWRWITPAVGVFLSAFSVNLVGDALRDALDPRANER